MITARKSAGFNFVLKRLVERTLRRRFHNVYIGGAKQLRELPLNRPVVGCVNHTNWWDGFVLYAVSNRLLPHDIYLAMEEGNLRRYGFFRWMGVFGLDSSAPLGLRYAIRLLRERPSRLAWMFVQGKLLPSAMAIEVQPGALFLACQVNALILPVTLRYEWLAESRPSVFVEVGTAHEPDTKEKLSDVLNVLHARTKPNDLAGYRPLFPPDLSINERWDRWRARFGFR